MLGRAWSRLQRRRPLSDERGFALVEIVITVWIIGAVMVALWRRTVHDGEDLGYRRSDDARLEELRRVSEALRAAPYVPCEDVAGAPFRPEVVQRVLQARVVECR